MLLTRPLAYVLSFVSMLLLLSLRGDRMRPPEDGAM